MKALALPFACVHTCPPHSPSLHQHSQQPTDISADPTRWCLQTSLSQFNQLYELAIERSEKAALPSKRISNIIEYMTYEIYLYIQRGLFERHKIVFALMLANKVRRYRSLCRQVAPCCCQAASRQQVLLAQSS